MRIDQMTFGQLRKALRERVLPTEGTKEDLEIRLREDLRDNGEDSENYEFQEVSTNFILDNIKEIMAQLLQAQSERLEKQNQAHFKRLGKLIEENGKIFQVNLEKLERQRQTHFNTLETLIDENTKKLTEGIGEIIQRKTNNLIAKIQGGNSTIEAEPQARDLEEKLEDNELEENEMVGQEEGDSEELVSEDPHSLNDGFGSVCKSDTDGGSDCDVEEEASRQNQEEQVVGEIEDGSGTVSASIVNKKRDLTEEGLALEAMLVSSKRIHRDILDAGWNRDVFNIGYLPDWFLNDGRKQSSSHKEMVDGYKKRLRDLNVRPIHKVIKAKVRKKERKIMNNDCVMRRCMMMKSWKRERKKRLLTDMMKKVRMRKRKKKRINIGYFLLRLRSLLFLKKINKGYF